MVATTNESEPAVSTDQALAILTGQASELRGAMIEALSTADDAKMRKLALELAGVNKQIGDIELSTQGDARNLYRDAAHDALDAFEVPGMTLSVKYKDGAVLSAQYMMLGETFDAIKAAVDAIDKPSSVVSWAYGRDEEGYQSFDWGSASRSTRTGTTTPTSNGERTVGWTSPSGTDIALGDAFDTVATATEKAEYATKVGGSAQYAYKSKVVKASGYSKK